MSNRIVTRLTYHLHWWQGVARLCALADGRPLLAVFTFHRILDAPPPDTYLQGYERGQSLSSFEAQIEAIRQLFDICKLGEFADIATGRKQVGRRPAALLTFDDADSQHGRVAFASLFELGLPAVSFVPTGFIESKRRFYHLRLTNICNQLSASDWDRLMKEPMPADVYGILQEHLESKQMGRRALRHRLIPPFHTMDVGTRDRLLEAWERFAPDYTLGIECASWNEIRSWEDQGIDIGSHTVNHHRLTLLNLSSIESELSLSRQALLMRLRGEVRALSYPEGSYTDAVPALAEHAGYELGFTTNPGFVRAPLEGARGYLIPRISISGEFTDVATYSVGRLMLRHLLESVKRRLGKGPSARNRP